MKLELFPFQKQALESLRKSTATALGNYQATHTSQVVSYTAPTGAGKTIIIAALVESIYFGDENFPDQTDAIFVWLSDSPQLNEQSKLKFELKADKIRFAQYVTISDESFDCETLEDGHIYFLNTQKLSKSSNLTKHSDGRQYTIWETLANTVREKSDRLYFIIDEAHRGAKSDNDLAKATTIMQKFLKGSRTDHLPSMPVVIGMTATWERFNRLAEDIQSTIHKVRTTPEDVRSSGLLKDRIVITYPETTGNDMAVLQVATDEWKDKWERWSQYCSEMHYAYVNPIFVIQVQNGTAHKISTTNLDDCLRCIEARTGQRFSEWEVVHAFGEGTPEIVVNGLTVHYVEPSRISDEKKIKIVFFKETLSTGWDCPRAETMMSFRRATDHTYIAQLLGRMVRTPMQRHILNDETLNDVHLYLPQFNESTVQDVVEALQKTEGATIPADIESEEMGKHNYDTLGLRPTYRPVARRISPEYDGQMSLFENNNDNGLNTSTQVSAVNTDAIEPEQLREAFDKSTTSNASNSEPLSVPTIISPPIDREAVVKAINDSGLLTYDVRRVRISNYLKSMYALVRFLTQTGINTEEKQRIFNDIVEMIHSYVEHIKQTGEYEGLVQQVLQFKLSAQIFDVFGKTVDNHEVHDLLSTTETDIDRQLYHAEIQLGSEGVSNAYINRYYDDKDTTSPKIHIIIFAANQDCMADLNAYAERKFHELNDAYRRQTATLMESQKKQYDSIVSDGDPVSKHSFRLPETIRMACQEEGKTYSNHLFVDDSGSATIILNGWEQSVIEEEEKREDFVFWLRNPPRGSWALCIPYESDGEKKPMYPDFLVIRRDATGYIVDILEPHNPTIADNLGKAKGLAEYARQNPGVGRIQLIRMKRDSLNREKTRRLDMSKSAVRDQVLHCASIDELNHIFENDVFFN